MEKKRGHPVASISVKDQRKKQHREHKIVTNLLP